jgi:hypothetical protein
MDIICGMEVNFALRLKPISASTMTHLRQVEFSKYKISRVVTLDVLRQNHVQKTSVGCVRTSARPDTRLQWLSANGRPLHPAVDFGGQHGGRMAVRHADRRVEWRVACRPADIRGVV